MRRARTAILAFVAAWLLAAPVAAGKPLDARSWKRVRKILPVHLWQEDPKARKRAKVDRTWRDLGLDDATLTRKQMDEAGKSFDMMFYPKRKHGISDRPARKHLYKKMLEFWKTYL